MRDIIFYLYHLNQLSISELSKANDLILFIDESQLDSNITAKSNNLTLKDIANLTDIFLKAREIGRSYYFILE